MEKTNENAFSGEEIIIDVDELLQSPTILVQDTPASENSFSEMEHSPITIDEDPFPLPHSQNYLVIDSSSFEMEIDEMEIDEVEIDESPSPSPPDSFLYETSNSDLSSGVDDIPSSPDDNNSHQKVALKRETKLGLRRCYPIIWAGDLFMGKLQMEIAIKFITGDPAVSRAALPLGDLPDPTIHIRRIQSFKNLSQRDIKGKMLMKKENCVLLAEPIDNDRVQAARMEDKFIHLFRRKFAVGIVDFPDDSTAKPRYRMFIFPPSDFVFNSLDMVAPKLASSLYTRITYPHLLCHINTTCS